MRALHTEDHETEAGGDTVGSQPDMQEMRGEDAPGPDDYADGYRDGRKDAYASAVIFMALNPGAITPEWLLRLKVSITQGRYLDKYGSEVEHAADHPDT